MVAPIELASMARRWRGPYHLAFGVDKMRLFRVPYLRSHNEEIVSHLYHSGFQTGVCDMLSVALASIKHHAI